MRVDELRRHFLRPDAEYRPAAFWIWNDWMTREQIVRQLEEIAGHGFGGAFVHPRPGMIQTYLDEEWFDKWELALKTAKGLGIKLYLYDENSYPSGFGGGHVSSQLPDCLAMSVKFVKTDFAHVKEKIELAKNSRSKLSGYIRVFVGEEGDRGLRLLKDVTDEDWDLRSEDQCMYVALEQVEPKAEKWLAGFANVDLLRPEVAELFLDTVYRPYFERFGNYFGEEIPAVFMDEPAMTGSMIYGTGSGLSQPYSPWLRYEFVKRNGYDLDSHLPALFEDNVEADWFLHDAAKVRFDYYSTLRELWIENFMKPMQKWCKAHNIRLTGHFMDDEWPLVTGYVTSPSVMANHEYMDWPGIDMLQGSHMTEKPWDPLWLIMLEASGAANQLGKERVLTEAFGAGGWDQTIADFKRNGDWLLANGINFFCCHLTYASYLGARKRDHPQSFDWREPWWQEFGQLCDYFARVSVISTLSRAHNRILVLHPTLSGYLCPVREEVDSLVDGDLCRKPDMSGYFELLKALRRGLWDFDLGDEFILKNHGVCSTEGLTVGQQTYRMIILPREASSMLSSTMELLKDFLDMGGLVLWGGFSRGEQDTQAYGGSLPGQLPAFWLDGTENESALENLKAAAGTVCFDSEDDLKTELQKRLYPNIVAKKGLPDGVEVMQRETDDCLILFAINHSLHRVEDVLAAGGTGARRWDPFTGAEAEKCPAGEDGRVEIPLCMEHGQSVLWIVEKRGASLFESVKEQVCLNKPLQVKLDSVRAEALNILTLDYCDLEVDGHLYEDRSTIEASHKLFLHRGFDSNPWDNKVQYKHSVLDRNRYYGSESGFCIVYRFYIRPGVSLEHVSVRVEQGDKYRICCNGHPLHWSAVDPALERGLYEAQLIGLAPGRNELRLICPEFDAELEIEPVYVTGRFSVTASGGRWELGAEKPLSYGSLKEQGYPFYGGAVLYQYTVTSDGGRGRIVLPENLNAAAVSIAVNNAAPVLICADHCHEYMTEALQPGENRIQIRVCASLKNTLGPHHDPEHPRRTAWPAMWKEAPRKGQPAAADYDLIDYGLEEAIQVYGH